MPRKSIKLENTWIRSWTSRSDRKIGSGTGIYGGWAVAQGTCLFTWGSILKMWFIALGMIGLMIGLISRIGLASVCCRRSLGTRMAILFCLSTPLF